MSGPVLVSESAPKKPLAARRLPEICPECCSVLVRRVHGSWCPRCSGFMRLLPAGYLAEGGHGLVWRVSRPR